jgi:general secretion pathway protein K
MDIHNANITIDSDKLYLASEAVNYWAIEQIKQSHKPFKQIDNKGKILTFPVKYRHIYPEVITEGAVYDLQARFNLNNLTDETYKPIFYQLIGEIDSDINKQKRLKIVEATTNWISESSLNQTRHDELLDKYLKLNPPYLPAYQKMQSPSEIRAVYGVNAKIFNSLQPYITALPEILPININTASHYLLYSLSMYPQKKIIDKILEFRRKKTIKNMAEISPLLNSAKIPINKLCVMSNYYLIVSKTQTAELNHISYTTIKTIPNNLKGVNIDIVKQSFNTE